MVGVTAGRVELGTFLTRLDWVVLMLVPSAGAGITGERI